MTEIVEMLLGQVVLDPHTGPKPATTESTQPTPTNPLCDQSVAFRYLTEGLVPPHHGSPTHIHNREDEAFYILDGQFEIECGCEIFRAGPGTFALLPKDLPHRFQNLSDQPGKVLCVQSPGGIEEFFEHMSLLAKAGPPNPARIRELTEKYGIEFLGPVQHDDDERSQPISKTQPNDFAESCEKPGRSPCLPARLCAKRGRLPRAGRFCQVAYQELDIRFSSSRC